MEDYNRRGETVGSTGMKGYRRLHLSLQNVARISLAGQDVFHYPNVSPNLLDS